MLIFPFFSLSLQRSRNGIFGFGPGRPDGTDNIPFGDLRQIVCKKCGGSHIWICTDRSKAKARWCQVSFLSYILCYWKY
jgi:Cleavage inducing molecular chaperone